MTDDIERRAAERERELLERLNDQRRMAHREDFVYDKAQEAFWDIQDNTLHSAEAVDAAIPRSEWTVIVDEGDPEPEPGAPRRRGRPRRRRETLVRPSQEIMRVENDQFVEGSTWWPGKPKIIKDWFIDKDGAYPAKGRRSFNQYRPPPAVEGDPAAAAPWLDHLRRLWPIEEEREAFLDYAAHALQRPDEKPNYGVLLSGEQGTGKDAALAPLLLAVGAWNTKSIDADQVLCDFRPYLQALLLVVNEIRPSKDEQKASAMYNVMKTWAAAPPELLPLNDKYQRLRHIFNVLRLFVTTNHRFAFHLEPDDRRWLVLHTELPTKWHVAAGDPDYFVRYFAWIEAGGWKHVAAYLQARDLSAFQPKAPPLQTAAWRAIVESWSPDDALTAALARVPAEVGGKPDDKGPPLLFSKELLDATFDDRPEIEALLKSKRRRLHAFGAIGYEVLPCPAGGRWRATVDGREQYSAAVAFYRRSAYANAALAAAAARKRLLALAATQPPCSA
jgi:hypothetical protein